LALVTVAIYLVVTSVAYAISGRQGCIAASVAALLCLAGAELALLVMHLGRRRSVRAALIAMLGAMGLRLAIPLSGSVIIRLAKGPLLEAGALYYLIVFYVVTLAIEIPLEMDAGIAAFSN
jgi:hypothetical protein